MIPSTVEVRIFTTDEIKTHIPNREFVLLRSHKRKVECLLDFVNKQEKVIEAATHFIKCDINVPGDPEELYDIFIKVLNDLPKEDGGSNGS